MFLTVDKNGMVSFVPKKKSFLEKLIGKIYADKPTCYLKIPMLPTSAGVHRSPECTSKPLSIVWHASSLFREVSLIQCNESTCTLPLYRVSEWERETIINFILRNKHEVFYTDHYGNVHRCVDVK